MFVTGHPAQVAEVTGTTPLTAAVEATTKADQWTPQTTKAAVALVLVVATAATVVAEL